MMIRYDYIDSERFCMLDGSDISSSTIDRDDECDSFFFEFIKKILFETISIMNPMWKTIGYETSDFCEEFDEYSST